METVLKAQGHSIVAVPAADWRAHLDQVPVHGRARLSFMSEAHHRVRRAAVTELIRTGEPLSVAHLAAHVQLSPERTEAILAELERNLVFVVRNARGEVTWAFPVTTDQTPHRLEFPGGQRRFAA